MIRAPFHWCGTSPRETCGKQHIGSRQFAVSSESPQIDIGNLAQVRKINLGVNARAIHFAMPEQVADLFQGQAAIDKTRGTGMAKGVRSSWANGRPQGLPVMPDDFKDSAAGKRAEGAAGSISSRKMRGAFMASAKPRRHKFCCSAYRKKGFKPEA